jgi:hypothetical protein
MVGNIKEMETEEIIYFLLFERKCFIYQYFDKSGFEQNYEIQMCDNEWGDFIKFCLKQDDFWYLTNKTFESWKELKNEITGVYKY